MTTTCYLLCTVKSSQPIEMEPGQSYSRQSSHAGSPGYSPSLSRHHSFRPIPEHDTTFWISLECKMEIDWFKLYCIGFFGR